MDQTPPTEESAALTQGLEKKAEALPLCLTPMEKVSVFDFPETGVPRLTTASFAPILPTVAGGVHRFIGALWQLRRTAGRRRNGSFESQSHRRTHQGEDHAEGESRLTRVSGNRVHRSVRDGRARRRGTGWRWRQPRG